MVASPATPSVTCFFFLDTTFRRGRIFFHPFPPEAIFFGPVIGYWWPDPPLGVRYWLLVIGGILAGPTPPQGGGRYWSPITNNGLLGLRSSPVRGEAPPPPLRDNVPHFFFEKSTALGRFGTPSRGRGSPPLPSWCMQNEFRDTRCHR